MDTKDKWTEEVLLCGTWAPDLAEVSFVSNPMPLSQALAELALCDTRMIAMDLVYCYIVDCKGNILADKWRKEL